MNEDNIVQEMTLIDQYGPISLGVFVFAIVIGVVSISLRKSRVNIFSSYLLFTLFLYVLYSVFSSTASIFYTMAYVGKPDFMILFGNISRLLHGLSLIILGIGVGSLLVGGSFLFSRKK